MDFTIVTPSLNYGRYLGECLSSVAQQSGVSLEHLVIDGGSSDDSATVAARFPSIRWSQARDRGMSDAINKGFDQARGDWVMWLNADDRLKPGALAEILPVLRSSDADVVYGDWDFVNAEGMFLRHIRTTKWSRFVHVHHQCLIGSTAAFFRKTTIIDADFRLRLDFQYVMDGEFFARLHAAGRRFQHVPLTVADFRMHGENLSQRNFRNLHGMTAILRAEHQLVESRAIRRAYGITPFSNSYLNGLSDGILWILARLWKGIKRATRR